MTANGYGISIFFFFYLGVYFWLHRVFTAVRGLPPVAAAEGYSLAAVGGASLQ